MQPVRVRLGSCGVVDLLFTHITTPVLLVSSPVSQHVPLRITRLPTTRHEGEQVVQRIIARLPVPTSLVSRLSLEPSVDIEVQYQRSVVRRAKGSFWRNHLGSRTGTDKDLIDILESGVRITSVGPFRSQVCAAEWNVRAVTSALGRTMPSPSCSSPGRMLPFTLLFIFLTFTLRFQWV